MKQIDSPTDVALTQYEGEPEDTVQEIILKISGKLCLPIGLATAFRDHFSSRNRYERILQVFRAFKSELDSLQRDSAQDEARTRAIEERLHSPKFTEAVLAAAEEATRTAASKKLDLLASALGNGLDPDIIKPEDDLASFVRDVSQLSEFDIKALENIGQALQLLWLREHQEQNANGLPVIEEFAENAALEKLQGDDFYSTAYRLVGFGLALELPTKTGRRSSNNIRFTTTGRGRKLIALLKKRT
jgi:hypothetical protein